MVMKILKDGSLVIFLKTLFEDGCYDHEKDGYSQGFNSNDIDSFISEKDGDDDYCVLFENLVYETFENIIENPIYDMSNEGSVY